MADMLSQDEVDALLGGGSKPSKPQGNLDNKDKDEIVKVLEKGMEKAADVLSNLISKHVTIKYDSTDDESSLDEKLSQEKYIFAKVEYKKGIKGDIALMFKSDDAKIVANLMMGVEEESKDGELSELQISAVTESISQMFGASVTSLSSELSEKIDISSPETFKAATTAELGNKVEVTGGTMVAVYYFLVDDAITSEIRLVVTEKLAESILSKLKAPEKAPAPEKVAKSEPVVNTIPNMEPRYEEPMPHHVETERSNVNVKPVQFSDIHSSIMQKQKENIDLIMDVPLEVTVELGRTHKSIKEILEFAPGTIIELDKLAGEPIDILVNGKFVAKGEVIVIDENFGIRITEIIDVKERI